ncbi:MAG: hypothetical protein ACHP7M_02085 [Burkholderiales bacterium]|jgi:hypothetical protein
MKSILDPTFRYTPSTHTDLRRTFARLKREARSQSAQNDEPRQTGSNVAMLFAEQKLAHK